MAASLSRSFAVIVQMTALLLAIQASSIAQTTTPQAPATPALAQQTPVGAKNTEPDAKPSTEDSKFVCGNYLFFEEFLECRRTERAEWTKLSQEERDRILAQQLGRAKEKSETDHQFLVDMIPVLQFISQSQSRAAYEGVHREGIGKFQKIAEADAVRFGKSSFHREPISLTPEVLSFIGDYRTFEANRGCCHVCSKFNRDIAFVCKLGERSCQIMLCFNCGNALIINDGHQFYASLNFEAQVELVHLIRYQLQYLPKDANTLGLCNDSH